MLEQAVQPPQQPLTIVAGVAILIGGLLGGFTAFVFVPTAWWPYHSPLLDLLVAALLPFALALWSALLVLFTLRASVSPFWRRRFRLAAVALIAAMLIGGVAFAVPLVPGLVLLWLAAHSRRRSEVPV